MKTEVKQHELDELGHMYDAMKILKFSPELIAKFEKTTLQKLKFQHILAAQLKKEFYAELKEIRENNKSISVTSKRIPSQEPPVRCFRCGGDNTRKCGLFLHNEEIENYPKDFIPSRYKQRYECKDCEYPENKFYFLTHAKDNTLGLYFYPGIKNACYDYEYMRGIYNDIGIAEVLINNHTARTKLSIEEIDFVRTMLEKKIKEKRSI